MGAHVRWPCAPNANKPLQPIIRLPARPPPFRAAAACSIAAEFGVVGTCCRGRVELPKCPGKEVLSRTCCRGTSRRGSGPAGEFLPAKVGALMCFGWKHIGGGGISVNSPYQSVSVNNTLSTSVWLSGGILFGTALLQGQAGPPAV